MPAELRCHNLFASREDSDDPKLLPILDQAETIYFAGGDQSNYVRFWQDTPVQEAINRHIAAGKPIGGSSAGLAILGEFSFASIIDTIHSPEALADPYGNKVTISRDFLNIPLLANTITDTHFVKRDRLGRLLVFMARILQDGWAERVRAIAVDENAAVLVEPDGAAKVVGGAAYFLESTKPPEVCRTSSRWSSKISGTQKCGGTNVQPEIVERPGWRKLHSLRRRRQSADHRLHSRYLLRLNLSARGEDTRPSCSASLRAAD